MDEDPGDDENWEDLPYDANTRIGQGIPHDDSMGNDFVTIIDVSGVHHLPMVNCVCHGIAKMVPDCLFAGLFPASFLDIRTVFTFECLDDFRLSNLECKTTPYQYFQKLRRKTNPAFPKAVPDRYAELRRVSRQWRHLKKLKMHGFGHDESRPTRGDLATFCPTCPQPGVNLPDDWEDDPNR